MKPDRQPSMAERTPLTEDDLVSILRKEEQGSQSWQDSALSETREQSLSYYDRQPYGDEQEGSSQVVTSEFQDVVENVMPGLVEVFCGTDNPAQFNASRPGEEQFADEATELVQHVLMKKNPGFRIVCTLLKDALMSRLSGVNVDLEDDEETRRVPVQGLKQDEIDLIVAEAQARPGTELEMELVSNLPPKQSHEAVGYAPGMGDDRCMNCVNFTGRGCTQVVDPIDPAYWCNLFGMRAPEQPLAMEPPATFSGTITVTRKLKRVVIDNIAPEDIRFTPSARDEDKASFLGFVKRVTSSDLVQMLVDKGTPQDEAVAIVDDMRSERPISPEQAQRDDSAIINEQERNTVGDSERPLWVVVAYVRADANGDGVSEMLRVVYGHAGGQIGTIIDKVEWNEEAAIALATPILMPHTIVGRSLFDQTKDLQQIGSVLTRGMLNNLYMVNNPRPVVSDQVNLDSLLDWTPGSPIRLKAQAKPGDNHVQWLQVPQIAGPIMSAMEYFATVRENRTGIVRNTQGLEGQSVQNQTLGGLDRLMGAGARRQDLIAQTFAQGAIKRLYTLVYRAIKRAENGPVTYPIGKDTWKTVDPSQWPDDMAVNVDVGTGTGGKEAGVAKLGMVVQSQEKLVALQGGRVEGPFVTAENIANTAQALSDKLGYRTPGRFFQPPAKVVAQIEQAKAETKGPPPLDPMVQAQITILQEAAAAELQIKRAKAEAEAATARDKAAQQMEIERFKAIQWAEIERAKVGLKGDLEMEALHQKSGLKALDTITSARVEASRPPAQPNGSLPQ